MINRSGLLFFMIFVYAIANAQPTVDFGKVSPDEFSVNDFPDDEDAEAVVLYDIGKSTFIANNEGGYDVLFEKRIKIKILSEAGLNWGEIYIPLYRDGDIYEKILMIEGVTTNIENDKVVQYTLNPEDQYTDKINDHYIGVKIAMPQVKKGSVIEYRYSVKTQYIFKLTDWEFQKKIPVMYSEYTAEMIPFYTYIFLLQGANSFYYQNSYQKQGMARTYGALSFHDMVHIYSMKDIPAFRDEAFISGYDDYVIKLGFQLQKITRPDGLEINKMTTWEDMIKFMLKSPDLGGYVKASEKKAKTILPMLSLQNLTDEEKVKKIVEYVKFNYNWDHKYRVFTSKKVKQFMDQKDGSSAEKNLFLAGLLKAAGINATPVIMSTRDHGRIKTDYPFVHFFNNIVVNVKIGKRSFLTDATSMLYAYDELPINCVNDKGLLIQKDKIEWIPITTERILSNTTYKIFQDLSEDITIAECELNVEANGYKAVALKKAYKNEVRNYKKELEEKSYETELEPEIINGDDPAKPYILKSKIKVDIEQVNGKYFVSPFLSEVPTENIFTQKNRQNRIDIIYAYGNDYNVEIKIPEGYRPEYLPENIDDENIYTIFKYDVVVEGNVIKINSSFQFKKSSYKASSYNFLKYKYGEMVSKLNDKVVLIKVEE